MAKKKTTSKKPVGHNPAAIQTRLRAMSKGFKTALKPTDQVDVQGTPTPASAAAAQLDADLALYTGTDAQYEVYEQAKEKRDTAQPAILGRLAAYELGLRAKLGTSSKKLEDFGLEPKKPARKSAATKAKAASEAKKTRDEKK
jgi:hypothetical protein